MPEVVVHRKSLGQTYAHSRGRDVWTHLQPGTYPITQHLIKRSGLEAVWVEAPNYDSPVILSREPDEPRTWEVTDSSLTYDYRKDRR